MLKFLWLFILSFVLLSSCKQKETPILLPDLKSSFSSQVQQKDSSLLIDSFYLVGIDTMTTKVSLFHQKFPYLHILGRLSKETDSIKNLVAHQAPLPSKYDLDQLKILEDEKKYVNYEIDSLNKLLVSSDSITPIGYRAIYKVTIRKMNTFSVSDTIAYSLSLKMELADWDRNIEKAIDSLAIGNHSLRGPFNIKKPMK